MERSWSLGLGWRFQVNTSAFTIGIDFNHLHRRRWHVFALFVGPFSVVWMPS